MKNYLYNIDVASEEDRKSISFQRGDGLRRYPMTERSLARINCLKAEGKIKIAFAEAETPEVWHISYTKLYPQEPVYRVLGLMVEDVTSLGYSADDLDPHTMEGIADVMGDGIKATLDFYECLQNVCEELEIGGNPDADDDED